MALRMLSRRLIILSTLAAICCVGLFSALRTVHSASPQVTKRTFESHVPPHVPLKINIKADKEEKALDLNNRNWFRDIEIEITNTSDKPIYYLSWDLSLPDLVPEGRPNTMKVFLFSYGRGEFIEQNTKPIPEDIPIKPKATHSFTINEMQRVGFEEWRARNDGKEIVRLQVFINHLSYGDGTGFTTLSALPFPFKNNLNNGGASIAI